MIGPRTSAVRTSGGFPAPPARNPCPACSWLSVDTSRLADKVPEEITIATRRGFPDAICTRPPRMPVYVFSTPSLPRPLALLSSTGPTSNISIMSNVNWTAFEKRANQGILTTGRNTGSVRINGNFWMPPANRPCPAGIGSDVETSNVPTCPLGLNPIPTRAMLPAAAITCWLAAPTTVVSTQYLTTLESWPMRPVTAAGCHHDRPGPAAPPARRPRPQSRRPPG